MLNDLARIRPLFVTCGLLAAIAGCHNPAEDVAPAKVSAPQPSPAADHPAASGGTPTATAATKDVPAGAEALAIDASQSKIDFVGSKVSGSHNGGFKSFKGTWALVADKPESSRISAEVDMDSTWSDSEKLTGHLKAADFFDVAKYPTASFESTAIQPGSSDPKAKDATHTVRGNLALHGVTKSIEFPAKLAVTPKEASLDSEFFLNRKDFGIVYPGMANDLIRDEVVIKLAIRAPRKP